jgi:hypothetical protein
MPFAGHSSAQASSMITITGAGDHDQPDWLITMTGIRTGMTKSKPLLFRRGLRFPFAALLWIGIAARRT